MAIFLVLFSSLFFFFHQGKLAPRNHSYLLFYFFVIDLYASLLLCLKSSIYPRLWSSGCPPHFRLPIQLQSTTVAPWRVQVPTGNTAGTPLGTWGCKGCETACDISLCRISVSCAQSSVDEDAYIDTHVLFHYPSSPPSIAGLWTG